MTEVINTNRRRVKRQLDAWRNGLNKKKEAVGFLGERSDSVLRKMNRNRRQKESLCGGEATCQPGLRKILVSSIRWPPPVPGCSLFFFLPDDSLCRCHRFSSLLQLPGLFSFFSSSHFPLHSCLASKSFFLLCPKFCCITARMCLISSNFPHSCDVTSCSNHFL